MKRDYVADPSSLCGAERFVLSEGQGKGVEMVRMFNGRLDLTVALDRCMDIYRLFYRGTPVAYLSQNGMVSPRLAETGAYRFTNSFPAGFLYTCGLNNIGAACERNGETLPQHGSISYHPASEVALTRTERDGKYTLLLMGRMTDTSVFGQKLVLHREIALGEDSDELTVTDTLENDGFTDAEYMLMYHVNLGYPALDERARLFLASERVSRVSRIGDPARCHCFERPTPGREEEVYCHLLEKGSGCKARFTRGDFALEFFFDGTDLPNLIEWKCMASGVYVLGIEPATTPMPEKEYRTLKPGERAVHSVRWRFSGTL